MTMSGRHNWNGPAAQTFVHDAAWSNLVRAVEFLWNHLVVVVLNRSNPRPYTTPSLPGEPPRKRTGWLQQHVVREYDEGTLTARVGVTKNAAYGLYLELGTKRMAARPWLMTTVNKLMPQMQALMGKGP